MSQEALIGRLSACGCAYGCRGDRSNDASDTFIRSSYNSWNVSSSATMLQVCYSNIVHQINHVQHVAMNQPRTCLTPFFVIAKDLVLIGLKPKREVKHVLGKRMYRLDDKSNTSCWLVLLHLPRRREGIKLKIPPERIVCVLFLWVVHVCVCVCVCLFSKEKVFFWLKQWDFDTMDNWIFGAFEQTRCRSSVECVCATLSRCCIATSF